MMMKTILAASAAAMIAASPALAAGSRAADGTHRSQARAEARGDFHPVRSFARAATAPFALAAAPFTSGSGASAYAQADGIASSPVVIEYGEVIGADPDPNVRLQMSRDAAITTSPY